MSRIGKQPIPIPDKTDVSVAGNIISVTGPLGSLSRAYAPSVIVLVKDRTVLVEPVSDTLAAKALWGTVASHIRNMVAGVNEKFVKKLIIDGIGFRAEATPENLTLSVGFSHPVIIPIPAGVDVSVLKNVLSIQGIDKEAVGQFSANVRAVKKPEPYKGKGIRYEGEVVRRKQGKKAAA